jgi:hypothetical protein
LQRLRLDFLLKVYFAVRGSPDDAEAIVGRQLRLSERYLCELDSELLTVAPDSLQQLVMESKRAAVQGFVSWLHAKQERITLLRETPR